MSEIAEDAVAIGASLDANWDCSEEAASIAEAAIWQ